MSGRHVDPFDDPAWRAYAQRAEEELVPMLADSAVTISIAPKGTVDIQFATELGLSIMMGKPIVTIVYPGVQIPDKLRRVSDQIVEGTLNDRVMKARVAEAIRAVIRAQQE